MLKRRHLILAAALMPLVQVFPAGAQAPPGATDLPILAREVQRGSAAVSVGETSAPFPKSIDGQIDDWAGKSSMFGGTAVYSAGEFVYQDHLFDAHGPDDGRDAERLGMTDPFEALVPELYRLDGLMQADPSGELGIPVPDEYHYDDTYGDATGNPSHSDIQQVRVAAQDGDLALLIRTTTMHADAVPGVLVLIDRDEQVSDPRPIPFNSGISSTVADEAFFLSGAGGYRADLATGEIAPLPDGSVATDPSGYVNAVEALIPGGAGDGSVSLAVATGLAATSGDAFAELPLEMNDEPHANLANVAFRLDEPVRVWFDARQALSLHAGTIDPFFTSVDIQRLSEGSSETFVPGPGYHDRIFVSDELVAREQNRDGIFQHYGVYLPASYTGEEPAPLQWWLHWRGGNAHTAAGVAPRIFKHFGEDRDSIVVSPSGRGTGRWYVGKGHVDFLEVWQDLFRAFEIDRDKVYVTGHSMGGWGSYLLTLLYPDRFAAAAPVAGPVTQGAWTGADFPGCDSMQFEEYTPCYISANGSRPRDQHTRRLLENALHVPYAILHGNADELVPWSGVARQVERLVELGYRHRFYTYPTYEHYTHPIMDQWTEAAGYLHTFARDPNPARVVYKRDMLFELATEQVQSDDVPLSFDFDSAYWMSGLEPVDEAAGVASFDGRSLALDPAPHIAIPDAGGPAGVGTIGPYVMAGLQWLADPTAAAFQPVNGFEIALSGVGAVAMDMARMGVDVEQTITGAVDSTDALELRLLGFEELPTVLLDGTPIPASIVDGALLIELPAGAHVLTIG